MNRMTRAELLQWQYDWGHRGTTFDKDGVSIYPYMGSVSDETLFMCFRYKNMSGVLHPDNGYRGPQPDGRDYYPLVRVSPSLSTNLRYHPACDPDMDTIAATIVAVWKDFIEG
jgi:hypothetical protein